MLNITQIIAPRVPLVDPATGLITREWYRYFYNLYTLTGGSNASLDDLQVGPPTIDNISVTNLINDIASLPSAMDFAVSVSDVQQKEIEGLASTNEIAELQSKYAVLARAINDLASQPIYTPQGPRPIYGAFHDSSTQLDGDITHVYPMRFDTTDYSSGVRLSSDAAVFTAIISDGAGGSGTILNVSAVTSGTITLGMVLTGTGVTSNQHVIAYGTGSGGTGTYTVAYAQNLSSRTFTGSLTSKIYVDNPGVYNIQFSTQFANTNAADGDINIWFRKNGADISSSNSVFTVPGKHAGGDGHLIAALNFFTQLAARDYVEIMWWSSVTSVYIEASAAATGPTRPAIPSVIATVNYVSGPTI